MPYIDLKQLTQLDEGLSAPAVPLIWKSAAASDVGRVRKANEDAFISSEEQSLWAVADGMGGHSRGDYASKTIVETLAHFSPRKSLPQSILDLDTRLKNAHDICRNTFAGEKVGSTVVALYEFKGHCFFVWAGDSRAYRLRDGELEQMTRDHTLAQQKVDRGELSPMMASMHPSAHLLTRAVGVNQTLYLELEYVQAQAGDRYLLCSDGLYNELERKQIHSLLADGSPQESVKQLIASALQSGGRDNTTVIVLDAVMPDEKAPQSTK